MIDLTADKEVVLGIDKANCYTSNGVTLRQYPKCHLANSLNNERKTRTEILLEEGDHTERAKVRTLWIRSGAEMAPRTRSIRFFSSCMSACL